VQAFDYVSVHNIEIAVSLLDQYKENARVLSGGTDLINQLREGRRRAALLVDIKPIPEVNQITYDPIQGLWIGAAVSCLCLCSDPTVAARYPGLVDAASLIGGIQIQARASLGGNLCNASPAADSIPALIVYETICVIAGPAGNRQVRVVDYCTSPGLTVLQPNEMLVALHIPPAQDHSGASYLRFTPRAEMDIAVAGAGAAVVLSEDGSTFETARIALGGVAPTPLWVPEAGEALKGQPVSTEVIERAAQIAKQAARPIHDLRGTEAQRRHLCGVLTRRALDKAIERARAKPRKEE
jgi:carbon-monoxide dehydrogenase medium subunit